MRIPHFGDRCPGVAIVGAGFCGTLVAVHLLRAASGPLRVTLIERTGDWGPGVAYSTRDDAHVLNVPAARMSAFATAPGDFCAWSGAAPAAYVPRRRYGDYLRALLAAADASSPARLERVHGDVVDLRLGPDALSLELRDGRRLRCDRAALATGGPPAAPVPGLPDDPRVVLDPWRAGPPAGDALLLVGAGLTAIDVALTHTRRAPAARVVAVSRSGRLPFAQLPGLRAPAPPLGAAPATVAALEHAVRKHVAQMQAAGYDWRDAIDGMRPVVPQLWRRLPVAERRRFLDQRSRAWEVRRHRMAPEVAAEVAALRASGRLTVLAGRVAGVEARADGLRVRLAAPQRALRADEMVTCTGPGSDVSATADPLLRALLSAGHASADVHGLGLRATPRGVLLDAAGRADERLRVLGPLRRGELWESTAVGELRDQAAAVAEDLHRGLTRDAPAPAALAV